MLSILAAWMFGCICEPDNENSAAKIQPVPLERIVTKGELALRIEKNFDRLEEGKYRPDSVFLTEEQSGGWPGDTEGRTILGLTLDARASKREPVYLQEIIERIPRHLNREGYMGPIYEDAVNEQQLSGNGWMLRGLCEYYEWKKDEKVLPLIASIVNNLFVKGKGFYRKYPIDPDAWKSMKGAEAGSIQKTADGWMLSSDIGHVFVGMAGAIHAYKHLRSEALKEVIEEMMSRFLETDLVGIRAQTHAALTACRGLIRYAEITGERKYVDEAAKRWQWYRQNGMTENYENYNWFGRLDTWTEACAVIDSYILAVQLWQHTREAQYLHDAELIYYNAICHLQRHNGGFGCDNCPGKATQDSCLKVHIPEAHWCCTMRGGEGLPRVAEYSCFAEGSDVYIPFFHENELSLPAGLRMRQHTAWPFEGKVRFVIEENTAGAIALHLRIPLRTTRHRLRYNGKEYPFDREKQFAVLKRKFNAGDEIEWTFDPVVEISGARTGNTEQGQVEVFYGPLMLGCEHGEAVKLTEKDSIIPVGTASFKLEGKEIYFTPLYHLMDPAVWNNTGYKKQILF
jgi:hypothetical protein